MLYDLLVHIGSCVQGPEACLRCTKRALLGLEPNTNQRRDVARNTSRENGPIRRRDLIKSEGYGVW